MNIKLSKFFLVCLTAVGSALPAFAASDDDPNRLVTMVTYFPVPYAQYNNLYIKDKFDVGVQKDGNFVLELGSPTGAASLSADTLFLRQVKEGNTVQNSTLKINTDLNTQTAIFGNTSAYDNATAAVNTGYLQLGTGASSVLIPNLRANTMNISSINLFGRGALPTCGGTGYNQGTRWQELTIGGNKGYYLVCCQADDDCVDCYYNDKEAFESACVNSVQGASWCSNKSGCSTCGCSCPANSHQIEGNTLCECDDTHMHPDGGGNSCVPKCSVNSYKRENKSECCPGVSTSDPICYVLRWGQVYSSNTCEDETNCSAEVMDGGACANPGTQCKIVEKAGTCKTTYLVCKSWPNGW